MGVSGGGCRLVADGGVVVIVRLGLYPVSSSCSACVLSWQGCIRLTLLALGVILLSLTKEEGGSQDKGQVARL